MQLDTAENAWIPGPEAPTVAPGRVDVWRIDITGEERLAASLRGVLSADETARADRFVHAPKRQQFTIARGALREILSAYLGCAPARVVFEYSEHGKPSLAGAGPLRFNLSHSRDLALCAVTRDHELGIDTEYIRPDRSDDSIARRFFAPGEVAELLGLDAAMRAEAFYHCWTSKEAYVKALGSGLLCPLDGFRVAVAPGRTTLLEVAADPSEAARWTLRSFPVPPAYAAACAVRAPVAAWRLFRWAARD